MTSTSIFWRCFVSLVKIGYWSKIHVNIITCSGIMTIFFYKGLIRNPEIGNTHVWVFPHICRVGQNMDTKFGTNVSNKILLNAAKFQGYSFYRFWVIKGKPNGGGGGVKLQPRPPRLGSTNCLLKIKFLDPTGFVRVNTTMGKSIWLDAFRRATLTTATWKMQD